MHVHIFYPHRPDWEGIGRWMSVWCFDVALSLFGDLRLEELFTSLSTSHTASPWPTWQKRTSAAKRLFGLKFRAELVCC